MGCMGSAPSADLKQALRKEEWQKIRASLFIGTSRQETKQRNKLWEQIDPDLSGSLSFPDVERGIVRALNLEKLLNRRQLTSILVRAFNVPKSFRAMEMSQNDDLLTGGSLHLLSTAAAPPEMKETAKPISPTIKNIPHLPPLILRRHTVSPSPARSPTNKSSALDEDDEDDMFNMPAVNLVEGCALNQPPSKIAASTSNISREEPPVQKSIADDSVIKIDKTSSSTNPFASRQIPSRSLRGADSSVNVTGSRPTSAGLSTSITSLSRIGKNVLLREEFRLFLMYIAFYMELYFEFSDLVATADVVNVSMGQFIAIETYLESMWGIYVDNEAEKVYQVLAKSKSGLLAYKDFADWAIREKLHIQLRSSCK